MVDRDGMLHSRAAEALLWAIIVSFRDMTEQGSKRNEYFFTEPIFRLYAETESLAASEKLVRAAQKFVEGTTTT